MLPLKGSKQDVKYLQQSTSVLETRCWCKREKKSKRKCQRNLTKKAYVPEVFVFGFQMVHGSGGNT